MIKSVTVTNFLGESLKLTLSDPYEWGIYVQEITGLGPPTVHVNITDVSGIDGGMYNSARADTKNVVLTLGFLNLEGMDVETRRQLTYKYFPLKKKCTLTVETDHRNASIDGYVESNEPDIFQEQETAQISILCPSPWFYSENEIIVFRGTDSLFEFPYENDGLNKATEFGGYVDTRYKNIFYNGDVDTGVLMVIHCTGDADNVTIVNRTTRELMYLNTDILKTMFGTQHGLLTGDDVIIDSITGEKSVTLYRGGNYYNIINCLDRGTSWITLVKGENVMAYVADSGLSDIEFKVISKTLYEGI